MLATSNTSFLAKQNLFLWKKIGEGSFSSVYLTKFGETVNDKVTLIATKIINKNRVSVKFVEKFLPRELDVLLKLRHPFIVQVYSIYQQGYKIFINMEYAENGDMYMYLQKGTLTEPQIHSWSMQILWAFKYMHGMSIVHRDMKCENVLLTNNYNVRIADFGFARFVNHGRNPSVDTVCGTLAYSSPELLLGTRPYNPMAVDVWAVGVVIYMMANNVAPFRDKNKEEMYKKQISKNYSFRKVLDRNESLIELVSSFLEPDITVRARIRDAFQNSWIRSPNIKTPLEVHNVNNKMNEINKRSISIPIITKNTLKSPKFHYQITEHVKSISTFNEAFTKIEDFEDEVFRQ